MPLLEKIKDRIKKLLGLARNNPEAQEAASAKSAAQKLLDEHGLNLEDIEDNEELDRYLLGSSKRIIAHWKLSLAMVLSNHHKCTVIYYEKIDDPTMKEAIYVVGQETAFHALYTQYWHLHDSLRVALNKAALIRNVVGDIAWKDSFLEGAIDAIEKRLRKERDDKFPPAPKEKIVVRPKAPPLGDEPADDELPFTSLVKREKDEQEESDDWARENLNVTVEEERPFSESPYCEPVEEAYRLGQAVGWGLSLTREELQKALTG